MYGSLTYGSLTASVKKLPTLAPARCVKKCSTCISLYYASNYIQSKMFPGKFFFHFHKNFSLNFCEINQIFFLIFTKLKL